MWGDPHLAVSSGSGAAPGDTFMEPHFLDVASVAQRRETNPREALSLRLPTRKLGVQCKIIFASSLGSGWWGWRVGGHSGKSDSQTRPGMEADNLGGPL